MDALSTSLARCLARNGVRPDPALAIGCSGGTDSLALAHMVASLAKGGEGAPPTVIHVDHGLRDGAAADAERVRAAAATLGLGFHLERVVVARQASLEDAARRARYAAFERAAEALGVDVVLLAHTADDQAETVLHRILRGTGVAGLAAMAARRDLYLRPLLQTSRAELADYCARHGLAPIEDPMNLDPRFARVRIRARILPVLAAENPRIGDALNRLAGQAREHRDAIDWAAAQLVAAARDREGCRASLLAAAPAAIGKRALIRLADEAGLGPLTSRHVEALYRLVTRPRGGAGHLDLPGGEARREYDRLDVVATVSAPLEPAMAAPALEITGPGGPYQVRTWRPGDRMRPARLRGRSRKLSDLYTDLRLPRALRGAARVVIDPSGAIVWAEHIGAAHECPAQVSLTVVGTVASNRN